MKNVNQPPDATMMDTRMLWRHSLHNAHQLALAQMLAALLGLIILTLAVRQSGLPRDGATAVAPAPVVAGAAGVTGNGAPHCAPQTVSKNSQRVCKPDTIQPFDGL